MKRASPKIALTLLLLLSLIYIAKADPITHWEEKPPKQTFGPYDSIVVTDIVLKPKSPWGTPIYGLEWNISGGSYSVPQREADNTIAINNITDIYIHDGLVEIDFETYEGNRSWLPRPYPDCVKRLISGDEWDRNFYITIMIYTTNPVSGGSEYRNLHLTKTLKYNSNTFSTLSPYPDQCDSPIYYFKCYLSSKQQDPDTIEFTIGYENLRYNDESSTWFYSDNEPPCNNFIGWIWSFVVNDSAYYVEGDDNFWIKRELGSPPESIYVDTFDLGSLGKWAYADTVYHGSGEPKTSSKVLNVHSEPFDTLFYFTLALYSTTVDGIFNSNYPAPVYAWFQPGSTKATKIFTDSLFINESKEDTGLFYVAGYQNYVIAYLYYKDGDSIKIDNRYPNYLTMGVYEILDTSKTILSYSSDDYNLIKYIWQNRRTPDPYSLLDSFYNIHPLYRLPDSTTSYVASLSHNDILYTPKLSSIYQHIEKDNGWLLFTGTFTYWFLYNSISDDTINIDNVDTPTKYLYGLLGNEPPFARLLSPVSNHIQTLQTTFYNNYDTINVAYENTNGGASISPIITSTHEKLDTIPLFLSNTDESHHTTQWKYITTTYPDIRSLPNRKWRYYIDTSNTVSNYDEDLAIMYEGIMIPHNKLDDENDTMCICYSNGKGYEDDNTPLRRCIRNTLQNANWADVYPAVLTSDNNTKTKLTSNSLATTLAQEIKYSVCSCTEEKTETIDSLLNDIDTLVCGFAYGTDNILIGCRRNSNYLTDSCSAKSSNKGVSITNTIYGITYSGSESTYTIGNDIIPNNYLAEYVIDTEDIDSIFNNDTIYYGGGFRFEWIADDYLDYINIIVYNPTSEVDTDTVFVNKIIDALGSTYEFRSIEIPSLLNINRGTDSIKFQFLITDHAIPFNGAAINIYMLLSNYNPIDTCGVRLLYTDIGNANQEYLNTALRGRVSRIFWSPLRTNESFLTTRHNYPGIVKYIPYFNDIFVVRNNTSTCQREVGIIMSSPYLNSPLLKYNGNASNGLFLNYFYTYPDTNGDSTLIHIKDADTTYRKIGW